MAIIGKPTNLQNNNYTNITMENSNSKIDTDKGDTLKKITGTSDSFRYVDGKDHGKLGKDGFLKLLTFQMTHQDPLNPMDQKKFASDLAQFSSLEQLSNMNTKMDKMVNGKTMEDKFYGASFLGKVATSKGTTVEYKGDSVDIPFYLSKNARNAVIRVMDNKGQLMKQLQLENITKGNQSIMWDGKSTSNKECANGIYNVEVIAFDESMKQFNGETRQSGVVTGVSFNDGQIELQLDGKKRIFLRDIDSFKILEHNDSVAKSKGMVNPQSALESYNNNMDNM